MLGYSLNGYYDDEGHWQRMKFCFQSCGPACDCGPPGGIWYDARHDVRLAAMMAAGAAMAQCDGGISDGEGDQSEQHQ